MKNFGFGMMRLPMNGNEPDYEQVSAMVDKFFEHGFTYFDTAHPYIQGLSEVAVKRCLSSRYPRESYILTNKLTSSFFNTAEEIVPLFEEQLNACGVEYFDYYLMHAMNAERHEKYKRLGAYEIAQKLKEEGRIKHIGISFHDTAKVLEKMLSEEPCIEVVQLQLNYVDFDDESVEAGKCYDVCVKYGKPVIVMEPVKGGSLVNLPKDAMELLTAATKDSPAGYAIRYAASFENVMMVLSGMSNIEQMEDNIGSMENFVPFGENDYATVEKICEIFKSQKLIPCTSCHYCTDGCPQQIPIPEIFFAMNKKKQFDDDWYGELYYERVTAERGKACDCIKCGACESACPQHLKIRDLLVSCSEEFDK